MTHGSKTNTSKLNKKISFQYISLYVKFTHFINVKYFNSTISMYYMFSIQVTNYISNYIWCLSYQFFSCFTPPPMVTVQAVRILLECILVVFYFWLVTRVHFGCLASGIQAPVSIDNSITRLLRQMSTNMNCFCLCWVFSL